MEQGQSTALHQSSYLVMGVLWFLTFAGYGLVWALGIVWGAPLEYGLYYLSVGGLLIGILQGLLLRKYLVTKVWWKWVLSSLIGWFLAMGILSLGGFAILGGSGLNDVDLSGAYIRGCGLALCCAAGGIFGFVQ